LGGSVRTVNEKAEALIVASKEVGLDLNVYKSKYVFMSRDQNAGRIHSMNVADTSRSFERVEELKYLGKV